MFVLTILNVSRVHQHYPVLGKFRPALLLVVASVGYAYLNPKFLTRANVLKLWPMRVIAILAVLSCCSAAFGISSEDPRRSFSTPTAKSSCTPFSLP